MKVSSLLCDIRVSIGCLILIASLGILGGCSRNVEGVAVRAGVGQTTPTTNSAHQYPNLLKECEVLSTDVIAEVVDADKQDVQGTFVGAICRWQASTSAGTIDITRFWFEHGSLEHERQVAHFLGYQVEERAITGVPSIVMRTHDPHGACGVASDAAGVVGWWINPQTNGVPACDQAIKLMELTLATNA